MTQMQHKMLNIAIKAIMPGGKESFAGDTGAEFEVDVVGKSVVGEGDVGASEGVG